jgi:endoglucanase
VGFYPDARKVAVVVGAEAGSFAVVETTGSDTVHTGTLREAEQWDLSGEQVRRANFSEVQAAGTYELHVEGVGGSHPFSIAQNVHRPVAEAALKAYYYQRMSTPLTEEYAGKWARPMGHPDENVRVHPAAASEVRPEGTEIAAPKGWYDAGDFNKYIVNSGISTYTLLALYEHYPAVAADLDSSIPASGNEVPDVLDEALWNLRWMMDMQAPDGGVYHKLTHPSFQGMIMPHEATAPRYVVQKSTPATLDFAAVMAQGARLYDGYADTFPGLADSMRTAALTAWNWARAHPDVSYNQDAMNEQYDPDVVTGAYGDEWFEDEFAWAAAELAVTTEADSFLTVASPLDQDPAVPSWASVGTLGWMTLLEHREDVASAVDTSALTRRYRQFADDLVEARQDVPYRTVMGHDESDFVWGSNSVAGNQAMVLLQAERLTNDPKYSRAALANLDYLLGRNATGFSFVTGHGDRTPMHIHHRASEADGITAPVPGFLAGGPNPGQQDAGYCEPSYPSDKPARSYIDALCSYASNEVTINWNAPLVYVAAVLEGESLSVETSELGVRRDDERAILTWKTTPEAQSTGFRVQYQQIPAGSPLSALSPADWTRLGFVGAENTTGGPHSYQFETDPLGFGRHVFRVQSVGANGRTTTTETVDLQRRLEKAYAVESPYPNPVQRQATLSVTVRERQPLTVRLFDLLGRQVQTVHDRPVFGQKTKHITLPVADLASGAYFVQVRGETFATTRRVTVVR